MWGCGGPDGGTGICRIIASCDCNFERSRDFPIWIPMKSVAELEVVPPEGLSAWDARAVQTGCRVAVPNTEGSGWVGEKKGVVVEGLETR